MRTKSTSTKIYRDYTGIEEGAYRALVRFYESKATEIAQLNFEVYFEILVDYTNALFEIGAYSKHLEEVENIIRLSISHNIQFYKGEDIYCKSLYQKAASHYNILEFKKAEHILKELIKITPSNDLAIRFLKKCQYRFRPTYIKYARATSIVLFLGAALIAAIEVLIIHPFSPANIVLFEYLRVIIFGLGFFLLGITFLYHRFQANRKVNRFVQSLIKNRNKLRRIESREAR